ncbi:hypothetical protein PGTUg99_015543 [Puccinia graminis f. sp. tritici]|uniref:Uncharacterized protein n=1 Tax=Puccinia graminis f. sp. tritici TaxID=56615 RepID=A0A5B0R0S9_PUCGR|nr:hypothetical protein PGTUg99_015543 [Puccinia graminis f. sp. tritici]
MRVQLHTPIRDRTEVVINEADGDQEGELSGDTPQVPTTLHRSQRLLDGYPPAQGIISSTCLYLSHLSSFGDPKLFRSPTYLTNADAYQHENYSDFFSSTRKMGALGQLNQIIRWHLTTGVLWPRFIQLYVFETTGLGVLVARKWHPVNTTAVPSHECDSQMTVSRFTPACVTLFDSRPHAHISTNTRFDLESLTDLRFATNLYVIRIIIVNEATRSLQSAND